MKKTRSRRWLVLGLLLLGIAGWLMSQDDEVVVGKPAKIDFPNYLTEAEAERVSRRRSPDIRPRVPSPDEEEQFEQPEPLDPVLRAFGTGNKDGSLLVFEANAIRHSALGEAFLNCLGSEVTDEFQNLHKEVGLNPLEDIDRMAIGDNSVVFSGHFDNVQWGEVFNTEPDTYGDHAQIFSRHPDIDESETGTPAEHLAVWNNEMLIVGKSREELEKTIDTLEGRRAMESIPLNETDTYGEAYGNVSAKLISKLIPEEAAHLREQILAVVSGAKLHTNAMSDVAISARLHSDGDFSQLSELGRSLGGALSLGLAAARLKGDEELAQLLEFANVTDNDGELSLELALPEDYLKKHLDTVCARVVERKAENEVELLENDSEFIDDSEFDEEAGNGPPTEE